MKEQYTILFLVLASILALCIYLPEKKYVFPPLPPEPVKIPPVVITAELPEEKEKKPKFDWEFMRPNHYKEETWNQCVAEMRTVEPIFGECESQIIPARMFKPIGGPYQCPHYEQEAQLPIIIDRISNWVPCICPGDKRKKVYIKEINKLRKNGEAKRYSICEYIHKEIHAQGNGMKPGAWTAGIPRRHKALYGH